MALTANQLTALHDLCWAPWLFVHCTACGARLPVAPVPRCGRCGHKSEPVEGTWMIVDEATSRSLAAPWTSCHAHVCRVDLAALWERLEKVLRTRYGFEEQES